MLQTIGGKMEWQFTEKDILRNREVFEFPADKVTPVDGMLPTYFSAKTITEGEGDYFVARGVVFLVSDAYHRVVPASLYFMPSFDEGDDPSKMTASEIFHRPWKDWVLDIELNS